jgi:hypothetical protein
MPDGELAGRIYELGETSTEMVEVELRAGRTLEVALAEKSEQPALAFRVKKILAAWDEAAAEPSPVGAAAGSSR